MQVNISILVENTTLVPGVSGEYGFSTLISLDGRQILFDTGSADALFHNARHLGIDLKQIKDLVISHGHFDHTTALLPLCRDFGPKRIYAHPDIFVRRYISSPKGNLRDLGIPFSQQQLLDYGAEFVFIDKFSEIIPGIFISGEIPRVNEYEDTGGNFKLHSGNEVVTDRILDDMALFIEHPDGLIVISGCAHSGIINTINHARKMTGRSKILSVIGGTHLMNASQDRMDRTVAALKDMDIGKIAVGHCTGFYAAARLYNELGSRVVKADAGMTFHF